ncbi:hypothetical protein HC928_15675 [bacterium]|nr:hypothetical protein [bacterium]
MAVYVGISADTPKFAVDAIHCWWQRQDRPRCADETKLLIFCDAGGSNGYRKRNWKNQLQRTLYQLDVKMRLIDPTIASTLSTVRA